MTKVENFISARVEQANISCKTLLVTFFGDVISIHGGWIWLGSLITSLSALGYSERLVRTSVFRLVEDDWLKVKKIGRKSYYSLTQNAENHNKKAARRIYASSKLSSSDEWLIVIPSFVAEEKIEPFKRQIRWLGFSTIASSVYAHPSFDKNSLDEMLREMDLFGEVIVFSASTLDNQSSLALKKLVFQKWNLKKLQNKYEQLITDYKPILDSIAKEQKMDYHYSFLLRLLVIHEYRRVLLNDHELSQDMLPNDWSGIKANQLITDLYAVLEKPSSIYISDSLESMDGFLPKCSEIYKTRFK
ncbi:MAG: hypothetical protein COA86_00265 [Kangiella sp.]|nr:MAG: hypothetical protein COA86_00265 [Kangiella sp.]